MDSTKVKAADVKHEMLQLTQEALKLATAACHFDKIQNVVGACDYYDKCLLNIDEVLNKLAPNSEEWKHLLRIRSKYDDRMEFLRETENSRYTILKSDIKVTTKRSPRKRIHFSDDSYTVDGIPQSTTLEATPENQAEIPFWQLRNINNTIQNGGFLTNSIYIPQKIWLQTGIRFSGLAAKTTAFNIIIKCLTDNIEPLYLSDDDDSLAMADIAFGLMYDEFAALQNQLSKPFPFIKERRQGKGLQDGSGHGSSHGNTSTTIKSTGDEGSPGSNASPGSVKTTNRTFATMVSSIGKNMKKYAELSYQRLVVALPSRMTAEDMKEYTALINKLCDKTQILDTWFRFIVNLKKTSLAIQGKPSSPVGKGHVHEEVPYESVESPTRNVYVRNNLPQPVKTLHGGVLNETSLMHLDAIIMSLQNIASCIRDICCEILLRDVEALAERYLLKTRKSFARMYWDDDVEYVD